MRKAINENPLVQAGLIGVLALVVGLMLLMRMGGGSAEPAPSATPTDPAAAAATDPATGTPLDPAVTTDPATGAPVAPAASPDGAVPVPATAGGASDLKAGPGLPQEIVDAYDNYSNSAVVLLIATDEGIDDRRLKTMVETLRSSPDAEVFVIEVKDVADYSRITEGVDVSRTPALVIMRPKALTEGPTPTAVVSYGYRGTTSVRQALKDALYKGSSDLPYYPK